GNEPTLEQQIAWRVAAHRQLGKNHQLRALADQRRIAFENFPPVANEITDGGIELGEAETHERCGNVNTFARCDNSQPGLALCVRGTISFPFQLMRPFSRLGLFISVLFVLSARAAEPMTTLTL